MYTQAWVTQEGTGEMSFWQERQLHRCCCWLIHTQYPSHRHNNNTKLYQLQLSWYTNGSQPTFSTRPSQRLVVSYFYLLAWGMLQTRICTGNLVIWHLGHQKYTSQLAITSGRRVSWFPDHQYQLTPHHTQRTTNQFQYPQQEHTQTHIQAEPYLTFRRCVVSFQDF